MRLLKLDANGDFSLTRDNIISPGPYAILSHTWGNDGDEVTFDDLTNGHGTAKKGYAKLRFCAQQAAHDNLQYFWVDTCCIDKSNSTELSEAINSMFRWYQNAALCYVYLADVHTLPYQSSESWEASFQESRWFTRGWTLQELLAPRETEFFCSNGNRLGSKTSLRSQICHSTGLPILALQGTPLSNFDFDERISWAHKRNTMREEDGVYSLIGILGLSIPIIYGEGREQASRRLSREWKYQLAESPKTVLSGPKQVFILQKTVRDRYSRDGDYNALYLSPDSKVLATWSGNNGTIQLWDAATCVMLHTIQAHRDYVCFVEFSPNSRLLASVSATDNIVHLWDLDSGTLHVTLQVSARRAKFAPRIYHSVAFSPDSKVLAAPSDNHVGFWDAATGTILRTLSGHTKQVLYVTFSPSSKLLASGSEDCTACMWDVVTGHVKYILRGHSGKVWKVSFSSDSKLLVSSSYDDTARIWNANTGGLCYTVSAWDVQISPDSRFLVGTVGGVDEKGLRAATFVRLWNVATGEIYMTLEGHTDSIKKLAFSLDSNLVASASLDRTIRLWDTTTGLSQQILEGHSAGVRKLAFSLNSKQLASVGVDGEVRLWSAVTIIQ